jgi:hypothetical protein
MDALKRRVYNLEQKVDKKVRSACCKTVCQNPMARPQGWWTTAVKSVPLPLQTAVEGRDRASDGFTKHGAVVVLANALNFAAEPLRQAQILLPTLQLSESSAKLNGYLFVATVLLLSVLDGIASAAQKLSPLPEPQGDVYFKSYTFELSNVVWIQPIQARLLQLQFDGKTFFKFANALKHEHAWVGHVSISENTGVIDVYDGASVGYLYQVLVPVYNEAIGIICRLAKLVDQPVPAFYKL